ncbi:MAG: hypothetical protein ACLQIB_26690 [Isosphaeraceae bacterium]
MSTATTIQAHIAHHEIEGTDHHVVVIEFLTQDITSAVHAREFGEQLNSLIRPDSLQYFVIDFANARSLGNTAFGEIITFVRRAAPVWFCNLDHTLHREASLMGLNDCAKFAVNRRMAINYAVRTAWLDQQDTRDYPSS